MNPVLRFLRTPLCLLALAASSTGVIAANPIVPGWYADPEVRIFNGQFWIYPTYSAGVTTPDLPVTLSESQKQQRTQSGFGRRS